MAAQEHKQFLGALTRRVWQWVRKEIQSDVEAAGFDDLTAAHVAVFRNPGVEGLRPGRLAAELNLTKQSVNDLLSHLEASGYIVRIPDAADSRSRIITLTERGRDLETVIWRAAESAERKALAVIGADRMRDLLEALGDLASFTSGDTHTHIGPG